MGFEIINRVLEELNREEYRRGFIAKSMDDEAMGGIVDDASFCFIIQKIVPRRDHAIQIQNKFKELWSSRNEGESSAPARRSSAGRSSSESSSTDSLLTVTRAAQAPVPLASSPENVARMRSSPAPGPSTSAGLNDEHDGNGNRVPVPRTNQLPPRNVEEVGNSGDSEFESFETPMTRVAPKRTLWDARLYHQQARWKRTKCQCTRLHNLHRPTPTSPAQEEKGTRSSSESESE